MSTIYLSLGSNIGDRPENIAQAINALQKHGVSVTRQSSLYETEPADVPAELKNQKWFVNGVVEAETELQPRELMDLLLAIEHALGRERRVPKGPRTIDIDILLFNSQVIHEPGVEIPHPRMVLRRFVLAPFAEIAPRVRHPVSGKTIAELLAAVPDESEVRRLAG